MLSFSWLISIICDELIVYNISQCVDDVIWSLSWMFCFWMFVWIEKNTMVSVQSIGNLRLGDRVIVTSSQGSKAGMLRFLGTTEFASGQWAGVELDDPLGKNDGAVAGTRYFDCQPFYGLFAPVHKVTPSPANHMRRTSGSVAGSMAGSVAGSTRGLGLTRQNTRDSFGSNASMISAVSRASTAVNQRVRPNNANPRLGVTSLTANNSPTHKSPYQQVLALRFPLFLYPFQVTSSNSLTQEILLNLIGIFQESLSYSNWGNFVAFETKSPLLRFELSC